MPACVLRSWCVCGWLWFSNPKGGNTGAIRIVTVGSPWLFSGLESACQYRGHGFDPWSTKTPHAMEQLSPCTTATKASYLELVLRNKRSPCNEKTVQHNERSPHLQQLERACVQQQKPSAAKERILAVCWRALPRLFISFNSCNSPMSSYHLLSPFYRLENEGLEMSYKLPRWQMESDKFGKWLKLPNMILPTLLYWLPSGRLPF